MALSPVQSLPILSIQEKHFSLKLHPYQDRLKMDMDLLTSHMTTTFYPETSAILSKELPSIFLGHCYNDAGLPFAVEVRSTEIAHLFEHIFLAYLHRQKITSSNSNFNLRGVTTWRESIRGSYSIEVNIGSDDGELVTLAIKQSMKLLNTIIKSSSPTKQIAN